MSQLIRNDFSAPESTDERWFAWRRHVQPFFDLEATPETDLSTPPAMRNYLLGSMILGELAAPAQILERSARRVAAQGVDHLLLQFHIEGRSRVTAGGRSLTVGPGEVLVYDLGQPITVETDGSLRAVNVLFPRALLGDRTGSLDGLHARAFGYGEGTVAQLLFVYLSGVISRGDQLAPHQIRPIAEAAAKLCTACLPALAPGERSGDTATGIEIRSFIQKELGDLTLDVDRLAARFGISRASLYRLFAEDGGVQAYIRERRLLKAMRLLSQPVEGVRPRISAVAYASGFADAKTFSRAFATRFGILPREARAGESSAPGAERRDDVLHGWIDRLAA